MKFKFFGVVLAAFLALAGVGGFDGGQARAQSKKAAPAVAAPPRLAPAETVYQAGEVHAGSTISHDFEIRNTGGRDLNILKVSAGCGCTVASFDRVIAPGQAGRITISVNVYADWAGHPISQSAVVESDDPDTPHLTLTVKAQVLPPG